MRLALSFAIFCGFAFPGCASAQEPSAEHETVAAMQNARRPRRERGVVTIGRNHRVTGEAEIDETPSEDVPALPEYGGTPVGRQISNLEGNACIAYLRSANVPFEDVSPADAPGIDTPVRLTGPVGGIEVGSRSRSRVHDLLDCRIVLAVLAWSSALREAHVAKIEHYSVYRPNAHVAGSRQVSGHASGMALDAAIFVFEDGTRADVNVDWGDRTRGQAPCEGEHADESEVAQTMRSLVCNAVSHDLFQVVLTPHFNRAHQNHVHLELRPGVNWNYVH